MEARATVADAFGSLMQLSYLVFAICLYTSTGVVCGLHRAVSVRVIQFGGSGADPL
jgi:fatty-acid desaturase